MEEAERPFPDRKYIALVEIPCDKIRRYIKCGIHFVVIGTDLLKKIRASMLIYKHYSDMS